MRYPYYLIIFLSTSFVNECSVLPSGVEMLSNTADRTTYAAYYNTERSEINVVCVNPNDNKCLITLSYISDEIVQKRDNYTYVRHEPMISIYGVELQTILLPIHNNTSMVCTCICHYTTRTVEVKFLLDNQRNIEAAISQPLGISFNESPDTWIDRKLLYINLPANKTLIKLYARGVKQWIYYEYEEGESLTLSCYTLYNIKKVTTQYHYLIFNNKGTYSSSISITLNLTFADDNTTLKCYLFEGTISSPIKLEREIHVLLRIKSSNNIVKDSIKDAADSVVASSVTDGEYHGLEWKYWLILAICGFLIIVFIILYNKKHICVKDKDDMNVTKTYEKVNKVEGDYSNARADTSMLTAASNLESQNSVSVVNNTCNEYKTRSTIPEITYAVLDLSPSAKVSKNIESERALYTEICHNVDSSLFSASNITKNVEPESDLYVNSNILSWNTSKGSNRVESVSDLYVQVPM